MGNGWKAEQFDCVLRRSEWYRKYLWECERWAAEECLQVRIWKVTRDVARLEHNSAQVSSFLLKLSAVWSKALNLSLNCQKSGRNCLRRLLLSDVGVVGLGGYHFDLWMLEARDDAQKWKPIVWPPPAGLLIFVISAVRQGVRIIPSFHKSEMGGSSRHFWLVWPKWIWKMMRENVLRPIIPALRKRWRRGKTLIRVW